MKKPLKNIIFTSASALFSFSTNAANIYSPDGYQVVIAGPITQGDFDKVRYVSRNFNYGQGLFLLNSQGGAAYEGMSIGEYINKKGFATAVLPYSECYSSCAIIWAAGAEKYAQLPGSVIGFHAIYNGYTGQQTGFANAKLGAVLGRWGYSDNAIEFMTIASPSQFSYLNSNTAYQYNIQYIDLKSLNQTRVRDIQNTDTQYIQSAYDVVKGFYDALSIADGDLAVAYVIPAKRGKGPFNQTNIYRFYSSLKEPLKVQKITPINTEQYQVNYTFRATKTQCKATALVTLENQNGYYLIKSIKANC